MEHEKKEGRESMPPLTSRVSISLPRDLISQFQLMRVEQF
jgi:hypothetical protein